MKLEPLTKSRKIDAPGKLPDDPFCTYKTGFALEADESDPVSKGGEGLQPDCRADTRLRLSKFTTDEVQESEQTPEQQYQRTAPRQWQVGDLIDHRVYGRCLLIMADCWPMWIRFISENGQLFDMSDRTAERPYGFSHNTGLQYTYSDQGTAERDFTNGLFTLYFEIL